MVGIRTYQFNIILLFLLFHAICYAGPPVYQGAGFSYKPTYTFATLPLPVPADNRTVYCTDCQSMNPCAAGGTGALALSQNGVWNCPLPNSSSGAGGNVPTNGLPAQTGTYNQHGFDTTNMGSIVGDILAPHKITRESINNQFNVLAYGAKCDGVTDDNVALQSVETAACAARFTVPFSVEGASVFVPAGGICKTSVPIIGSCLSGIAFNGDSQATINGTQIGGPTLYLQNSTAISSLGGSAALVTSALVGSGNSITWPAATPGSLSPFFFDMNEGMGGGGVATGNPLNGDTAFSARLFFKLNQAPNGQWLIGSDGSGNEKKPGGVSQCNTAADGLWSCGGAYAIFPGNDAKLHIRLTTSVTGQIFLNSGTATLSSGTTYEGHLDYDGTNVRLILNGILRAVQAATGTVVQNPDENQTMGWEFTYYPLVGPINGMQGTIDSVEVANVSRNNCGGSTTLGTTCYTMDTAKFTGDSHSQFLANFVNVNLPTVRIERANGTDTSLATNTNSAFMMLRNFGLGSGAEVYQVNNLIVAGGGAGIGANATQAAVFTHDYTGGTYYGFMDTYNASFNETFDDFTVSLPGPQIGMMAVGGITFGKAIKINVGYQTTGLVSGSGNWNGVYIAATNNCLFQFLHPDGTQPDTDNITLMSADNENGGHCPAITWNGPQNFTVSASALGGVGTGQPSVRIESAFFENATISDSTIQADPAAASYVDLRLNALDNLHFNGLKLDSNTYIPKVNNVPSLPYSNFLGETLVINSNGASIIPGGIAAGPINTATAQTADYNGNNFGLTNVSKFGLNTTLTWPLPLQVVLGQKQYCLNCDPPKNPPELCTQTLGTPTGATGSWVEGSNLGWLCGPEN